MPFSLVSILIELYGFYIIRCNLAPRAADGILSKSGDTNAMKWQVVKVYTMPDGQPGVKLMRIA